MALTGEMAGPSLFHLIAVLGQEACVVRLAKALDRLPDVVEQSAVSEG